MSSDSIPPAAPKNLPVLIDTDAGTDDALAIWMVLRAHQDPKSRIKVVGVSCVNGNTGVDNVVVNVARILGAVGEYGKVWKILKYRFQADLIAGGIFQIPIFKGSKSPILEEFQHQVEPYHGADGFGDVGDELGQFVPDIAEIGAVNAIIGLAKKYHGKQ